MKLEQISNFIQHDECFWNIPPFIGLKLLRHYSKIIQQLGNEQKIINKQLIAVVTSLLIQDASETVNCSHAFLNFTMLAQSLPHNNEILFYINHVLYRFDKTKIAFENHSLINTKLLRPTFHYPKFYIMTHFLKSIWDYRSAINYDTTYSEAAKKYFFEAFYGRINKKEYKLSIFKHNIHYTNRIAMQDAIT